MYFIILIYIKNKIIKMSNIKRLEEFNIELNDKLTKREYPIVFEGVATPKVKPITKPGIKETPGRPSPLRKDRPSVVPGPKAVTELDLSNKFLNLTKENNQIISFLKKKYNKWLKNFNESLRDILIGPTIEEIFDKYKGNPNELLKISIKNGIKEGIIHAIEKGADITKIIYYDKYEYADDNDEEELEY